VRNSHVRLPLKSGHARHRRRCQLSAIAAGNYLARAGFTSRGRIIAHGGSAGGMLMGAVANMAPDLFLGVIAEVPFVDVLTTMLDASLPLTPPEWLEWGNPIESAKDCRTIAAALSGLTDPRTSYWEPAKWVAKLRELKTDDHLLLLRTNMEAGHAGASRSLRATERGGACSCLRPQDRGSRRRAGLIQRTAMYKQPGSAGTEELGYGATLRSSTR
jgi:protease II